MIYIPDARKHNGCSQGMAAEISSSRPLLQTIDDAEQAPRGKSPAAALGYTYSPARRRGLRESMGPCSAAIQLWAFVASARGRERPRRGLGKRRRAVMAKVSSDL